MGIAGLVGGRKVSADQQPLRRRECRFNGETLIDRHRSTLAPKLAHHSGGLDGRRELAAISVDVQDATFEMIVGERGFGTQRLQLATAVQGQGDYLAHVVARSPGRAFAQEAQTPVQQRSVPAQPEQERRILAPHPGQST